MLERLTQVLCTLQFFKGYLYFPEDGIGETHDYSIEWHKFDNEATALSSPISLCFIK
jgi:hypothetical protein